MPLIFLVESPKRRIFVPLVNFISALKEEAPAMPYSLGLYSLIFARFVTILLPDISEN